MLAIELKDTDEHAHVGSCLRAFNFVESLKLRLTGAVSFCSNIDSNIFAIILEPFVFLEVDRLPIMFEDVKDSLEIPQQLLLVTCLGRTVYRTSSMVTSKPHPMML